jgi:hypothetical protein
MFAMLSRGPKAKAMLSEWMVDDLSEVSFPGVADGTPLAFGADFVDKQLIGAVLQTESNRYKGHFLYRHKQRQLMLQVLQDYMQLLRPVPLSS